MSGIVFYGSEAYDEVIEFYTDRLDATVWLEQADCTVLQYDNLLFGFCDRDAADVDGIVTFVHGDREAVDEAYDRLSDVAQEEPEANDRYDIYQFFATDPEGRTVEVQSFDHPTDPV